MDYGNIYEEQSSICLIYGLQYVQVMDQSFSTYLDEVIYHWLLYSDCCFFKLHFLSSSSSLFIQIYIYNVHRIFINHMSRRLWL